MPEEPDVSPGDEEILDRILYEAIEAKKEQRANEAKFIANRIMEALQARPDGMNWTEIREMFDKNLSDKLVRQALQTLESTATLKTTALTSNGVKETEVRSGEGWILSAAS